MKNKTELDQLILFISGVPAVGKTTVSYELLKRYNIFRIIQETDLIREILRGYNECVDYMINNKNIINKIYERIYIPDHTKIFNYDEIKEQCIIMKQSIEKIIERQQRKRIPSIINGVHIVPEVLNGIVKNNNIKFINLYINNKDVLYFRQSMRNEQKYMSCIDLSFETNCRLYNSTVLLQNKYPNIFFNIDVTYLDINQSIEKAVSFITLDES